MRGDLDGDVSMEELLYQRAMISLDKVAASLGHETHPPTINGLAIRAGSLLSILRYLNEYASCPTCPYLDSLEDEEEVEECDCQDDEGESGDFLPDLGTYIIFCKN